MFWLHNAQFIYSTWARASFNPSAKTTHADYYNAGSQNWGISVNEIFISADKILHYTALLQCSHIIFFPLVQLRCAQNETALDLNQNLNLSINMCAVATVFWPWRSSCTHTILWVHWLYWAQDNFRHWMVNSSTSTWCSLNDTRTPFRPKSKKANAALNYVMIVHGM
jgi:hypothetical protein